MLSNHVGCMQSNTALTVTYIILTVVVVGIYFMPISMLSGHLIRLLLRHSRSQKKKPNAMLPCCLQIFHLARKPRDHKSTWAIKVIQG